MANENTKADAEQDQLPAKKKGGRRSKLSILMDDTPDTYAQMIQYLRLGATVTAVSGAVGIDTSTFARWMADGRDAVKGIKHKFYKDVVAAVSHAAVMCEVEVKISNPMAWLKNGPRRLLGDEWRDESAVNIHGTVEHEHIVYDGRAPADSNTLAAALVELKNAGLLSLPEGASPLLGPVVDVAALPKGGASSMAAGDDAKTPP